MTSQDERPTAQPTPAGSTYDVVVVGARCAGSTVATVLARAGRRVLVVDRDRFPSDTVSTHQLFPDGLALLDELGAGDRLRDQHTLRPVQYSWRVLGHAVTGGFTPVGGHGLTCSIRRVTLDAAIVETAKDAGADMRFGVDVHGLLGRGTADDPVRGVQLSDGTEVEARWVVGADGRSSTVARALHLPKTRELRGDLGMLVGYWEGLPDADTCHIDVHAELALMSSPCEDGVHLLSVSGPPGITRGSAEERQTTYLAALRRFPAVLNPRLLDDARQLGPVIAVPETMLRGFERQASGPGWVLVGDSGLFKHPVTGQGIGDALAQAWYVGHALARGDDLDDYGDWRTARSAGHYEFSFDAGRLPGPRAAAVYAGLAEDVTAGAEFLDVFAKRLRPDQVLTAERRARWQAAATYERGLAELHSLLDEVDDADLTLQVPACPEWSVADLVAHVVGVAEDSVHSRFFAGAMVAWRDQAVAEDRERWTADQVVRRRDSSKLALLLELDRHGRALTRALRQGSSPVEGAPDWAAAAPVGDLAVHLADLREALGIAPPDGSLVSRWGFAAYRDWLHRRLTDCRLSALELTDGKHRWQVGTGEPAGSVTADPHELFRIISGRRSADRITAHPWTTDPAPYLPVIAPYPLPR